MVQQFDLLSGVEAKLFGRRLYGERISIESQGVNGFRKSFLAGFIKFL